ncbi:MAG: toll/interleukin-1 receptor domain-containing protein, partial [Deltaproteobacteria bacterium]|nr:toll/interleukin-1 receptor domain-containing protein [Deltaproteobacteria bacterium]
MSFDVFISHASRDRPTAEAVHQILESNGITCWISSRNITGGQRWSEAVVSAINNTRITVLILSANSSHSRWVPKEIELSVRRGGAIIPLRIEDAKPTGALELYLSEVQHIDAFDGPLDAHMDKLLETVRSYLSDGDTPRISTSQPAIADSGPSPVESLSKAERLRDASSLGRQDRFSGKSAAHRGKAGTEPASVVTNQQYDFDICLCSSKQDQPQVTRLMEELLLEGLTICWEDEGELVQQDVNDVERDIRASKIVIVCVGEHFYESVWNRRPYLDLLLRERHVRKATFHVVKVTNRVETGFPIFVQDQFFSDIREDEQRAAFVKWQVS